MDISFTNTSDVIWTDTADVIWTDWEALGIVTFYSLRPGSIDAIAFFNLEGADTINTTLTDPTAILARQPISQSRAQSRRTPGTTQPPVASKCGYC